MFDQFVSFIQQLYDLPNLIRVGGYVALVAIIFAETGLMFGFFLPGDSLLVTAGVFAATGLLDIWTLNFLLVPAAIIGDAFGYYFGKRVGRKLYERKNSRFFKKEHLVAAKAFYDKHGGKTIILARFLPAVRTFAPIVAGMSGMKYKDFAVFNVVGAILWVTGLTLLGYFLGKTIPDIEKNIIFVILAVILVSFLPAVNELFLQKKKNNDKK
ncbi:VTT domain-containing protein [Candidatus Micrarchaeota archaeon]|nr:VTT domain-containing protein [Candidatus Micrarchaeota archaeon]